MFETEHPFHYYIQNIMQAYLANSRVCGRYG